MKPPFTSPTVSRLVTALALLATAFLMRAAEPATPLPAGVADFAGRMARNHWYLLGEQHRAELEAINRDFRAAQQQLDKATADEARQRATARAAGAAERLRQQVKACPHLLRVDLTAAHPVLVPSGPFEVPGD